MFLSVSSRLCSAITIARNPQGKEENWLGIEREKQTSPSATVKFTAFIAYQLTAIVASIEMIVSGIFTVIAFPLQLISSYPYEKSIQWLESSAFSVFWSIGCCVFGTFPNLLTKEQSAKNLIFRGAVDIGPNEIPQAPLSSRLFMIIRELPSYLSTAYSLRYKDIKPEDGIFAQMKGRIGRYKQLIQELLEISNQETFKCSVQRLEADFDQLNSELPKTRKAICAYFVSKDTGAVHLENILYHYHHYKINVFKTHYDVSAKVVRNTKEMFDHLNSLKVAYPDRPIKVVDIHALGSSKEMLINSRSSQGSIRTYQREHVCENEFSACASDAAIILDASSTGTGNNSIAQVIAEKNPGKTVFAPSVPLLFSKPVFTKQGNTTTVTHVTHGFAVVNAYTARKFQVIGEIL